MTSLQKQVLATVIRTTHAGQWYRAASSGERVTLASLYYRGLIIRRAWRGVEGQRDAAHEYRTTEAVLAAMRELHAAAASVPFANDPHQGESVKTMKKYTCPHCGNRDPRTIEDNGERSTHPDYTLLCVARVAPGEDAFDGDANPPLTVGPDGKVDCGMQWCPNAERDVG